MWAWVCTVHAFYFFFRFMRIFFNYRYAYVGQWLKNCSSRNVPAGFLYRVNVLVRLSIDCEMWFEFRALRLVDWCDILREMRKIVSVWGYQSLGWWINLSIFSKKKALFIQILFEISKKIVWTHPPPPAERGIGECFETEKCHPCIMYFVQC